MNSGAVLTGSEGDTVITLGMRMMPGETAWRRNSRVAVATVEVAPDAAVVADNLACVVDAGGGGVRAARRRNKLVAAVVVKE
jgi:hypothetical protein